MIAAALAVAALAAPAAPARLMVEADEWRLTLSRTTVRAGTAVVQLRNAGEDPHDLLVRRRGVPKGARFAEQRPGALAERDLRLRRGTYDLLCTLPGHAKAGMRAKLKVR